MLISVAMDVIIAIISAFVIIYALTYSFYCFFLSDKGSAFSLGVFFSKMKDFTKRDNNEHRSYDKWSR